MWYNEDVNDYYVLIVNASSSVFADVDLFVFVISNHFKKNLLT